MTERFVGPFSLDLQRPAVGAREVAKALRAAWRGEHAGRPFGALKNLNPGVYGVYTPGDAGLPTTLTLWVTLDASWLEAGPAPGGVEPPLVDALLEALAEARWWEGAPLPAQLRPQVVLEWPPSLAARSACPATAVYAVEAADVPDIVAPAAPPRAPEPPARLDDAPTLPPDEEPPVAEALPPVAPPAQATAAVPPTSTRSIVRDELDYDDYWEDAPAAPTPAAPVVEAPAVVADASDELWEVAPIPAAPIPAAPIPAAPPPTPAAAVSSGAPEEVSAADPAESVDVVSAPEPKPASPVVRPAAVQSAASAARPVTLTRAAGRVAWVEATLEMRDGVHRGGYTVRALPEDGADARALVDWLRAPSGPCALPGGRVVRPLSGWLGRELELQPARGVGAGVSRALAQRALERPWRDMLRDASVSIFGVLMLAALVAGGAGLASSWSPEDAGKPPPPEYSPAISPCSADHAQFMNELRCQVAAMVDPNEPPGARCGDMRVGEDINPLSRTTAGTGDGDLRSAYCGLLHSAEDGRRGNLAGAAGGAYNLAELASSQACFNVLGHPDDYTQPLLDAKHRVADPQRLLYDETFKIASLQVVVDELKTSCGAWRDSLEANVRGAAFATHIGSGAPALEALSEDADSRRCDDDNEQVCMRRALGAVALRSVDPAQRACFERGATTGLRWGDDEELCGGPKAKIEGKAWAGLAGLGADGSNPLVAYVDARYPKDRVTSGRGVGSSVWACHLELTRDTSDPKRVEVAWGLQLPRPEGYALGGAGASTQLLLDAALAAMEEGTADAGRCWSLVRGLISGYKPVHPLLEELDPERWVSREQQLCAQVCAARYKVQPAEDDRRWWTRAADVGVCTNGEAPDPDALRRDDSALDVLQLPWNDSWYLLKRGLRGGGYVPVRQSVMQRLSASPAQVCAFHLIAQERVPSGEGGLLMNGRPGEVWAGTVDPDVRQAGGPQGAVTRAVYGFELEKNQSHREPVGAYGEEVCADVATQCYSALMLDTMAKRPTYQWVEAWEEEVRVLAGADIADVFVRDPWCAAVHAYTGSADRATMERPCAQGAQEAERRVKSSLQLVSRAAAGGSL